MVRKKLLALCLVMLLLPAAALGQSALRATVDGYFSVSLESGYTLDMETYALESTPAEKWLCMLYDNTTAIDVTAVPAKGYEGMSLADMDDAARAAFLGERMEAYALQDVDAEKYISSRRDSTPFYIYSLADLEGSYLLAETLQAGSYIRFCCYPCDFTEPTQETLRALTALLESYEAAK